MRVLHTYDRGIERDDVYGGPDPWESWLLTECPNCRGVCLLYGVVADSWAEEMRNRGKDPEAELMEVIYPPPIAKPKGLPLKIRNALDAAERVRQIDANAYGVLLGRLLELVCSDRGSPRGELFKRLQHLEREGEIPSKLIEVAHGLRKLRNAGAHPDLGELSKNEVQLLADLARAILEYVYTAPYLAEKAAGTLAAMKASPEELDRSE